jgi:hypothetical protein
MIFSRITIAVPFLLLAACGGQPPGGVLPSDGAPTTVAKQWAMALQRKDRQQFEATSNLSRLSYTDPLAASFEHCAVDIPEALGLVIDSTRGNERYMIILRYPRACLQAGEAARTDTVVVSELTMDGGPKVDGWNFGRPPGM